jgi:hypothetical protein
MIQQTIDELKNILAEYSPRFQQIPDLEFSLKLNPRKWSKKEVLGHLIDSGQNNLRRFITGQYESTPPKITYEQDFWVSISQYQQMSQPDIILLWRLTNERIIAVLSGTSQENLAKLCDTGKNSPNLHSIEWLAHDYVFHLKHHINQIIPGSFDVHYQ